MIRILGLGALGAVAALGLPPLGIWPATLAALAAAILLLAKRPGFWGGWALGFGYFIVAFHWIGFAFLVEADTYLWMMPFAVGGLAAAMAVYWGLAALAARWGGYAFAVALAVGEWLRGHLFTGFPWAAPGLVADGMGPVAQAAAVIGMTGLTLLVLASAAALTALAERRWKTASAILLVLLAATLWGSYRLQESSGPTAVTVRVVQPNIPQADKWRVDNSREILDRLLALSTGPEPVDATVWPEASVPFALDESEGARGEIAAMLGGTGVVIAGSLRRDGGAVWNSVMAIDTKGEVAAAYDKWRLVPGGEFLPFEWLLEPLGFRRVVTVPGSFQQGAGPKTLTLRGLASFAPSICYEAIFPDRFVDPAGRPSWLVNVTNDGWFGGSTGPYQHLAQWRLRSIEQGIPAVRAANTGISAAIDPLGRFIAKLASGEQGAFVAALPAPLAPTPYARFGDALAAALALALAGVAALRGGNRP